MRILIILLLCFGLIGCSTTDSKTDPTASGYLLATKQTKRQLSSDLNYGKLKLGAPLEYIMATYGEPDKMSTYKKLGKDLQYDVDYKIIFLYFQDGEHLSSWSEW